MKISTAITDIKEEKEYIRGYSLDELMRKKTFVETIFLLLRGELPTVKETVMMNALFTAAIDHGPGTASAQTARIVASAKNSMHTAVAAGILAMGERHGSAIEGAAQFFQAYKNTEEVDVLAQELKTKKIRVPGYGHPFLEEDHRSAVLFALAQEQGIYGAHCSFAEKFHVAVNTKSSKKIAFNIDGAMAAILLDMGFDARLMKGFFIIARIPGLVAQVYEEMADDPGIRRLDQSDIQYTGPEHRSL